MFDPVRAVRRLPLTILVIALAVYLAGPAPGLAATAVKKAAGSPVSSGTSVTAGALIAADVFSSGGQEGTSASFRLHDTFGQGPIGPLATGATMSLQDGFWATLGAKTAPGDTTHPGPVVSFEAFPQDTSVGLGWTTPSDADFAGILIRFSTTADPATPTEGAPVPNGHSGEFWNPPRVGNDWVHEGLTNGTTYHYTAFAFDSSYNYSSGVSISAVPYDDRPPGLVTSFTATAGDTTVTLQWTNPPDDDFAHTLITYSTVTWPDSPEDGTPVENGNAGRFFNSPASVDSFIHTHLTNGTTYYYAAFAADTADNYQAGALRSATPVDTTPPGYVQWFSVTAGERADTLRWQNPSDSDLEEVWIRYSTTGWAYSPTEGSPVENGNDGKFINMVPSGTNAFVHEGLIPNVTYNYSLFTFDSSGNYRGYTSASGTPYDHTPPELTVSVFQNPYVTNHLDVYVVASEALVDTSVHVSVGATELAMAQNDPDKHVWRGDYDLCCTGDLTIQACARDGALNDTCVTRSFSSALMLAASGGTARSTDGQFEVRVPGGALARDAYVLIFESQSGEGESVVYDVSPSGLEIGDFAEISIAYGDDASEPEHLCIARLDASGPVPIDSYLDKQRQRVVAYGKGLGSYTLISRPDVTTPDYGNGNFRVLANVPNPFVGSTSIIFEVARAGRAHAEIVSVEGRSVRTLADQVVAPGRNALDWDGCDDSGRRVAGGVYVCRIGFGSETVTHKMVHLH
ncbi:MAG: hypothetical protein V1694_07335 [Candidatus Eisenbacteria bacterium]